VTRRRLGPRATGGEQVRSIERAPLPFQSDSRFGVPGAPGQADAGSRGLGVRPTSASAVNPNQFAEDWILLRHVTVLVPPSDRLPDNSRALDDLFGIGTAVNPFDPRQDPFNTTVPSGSFTTDATSVYQGQPAARFLFRDVVREMEIDTGELAAGVRPEQRSRPSPRFDSGLVDVAMTSIEETRRIIQRHPNAPFTDLYPTPTNVTAMTAGDSPLFLQDQFREADTRVNVTGLTAFGPRLAGAADDGEVDRLHQWMEQLLPAASPAFVPPIGRLGERIRGELTPPELDIVRTETAALSQGVAGPAQVFAPDLAREDQFTLSASNLAPRCTEFIVEWSFGQVYSDETAINPETGAAEGYLAGNSHDRLEGELVWYGGTAVDPDDAEPLFITMYPLGDQQGTEARLRPYRPFPSASSDDARDHFVSRELLYGSVIGSGAASLNPLTTYFGTVDPTYPQDGDLDEGSPFTVPWVWPKLIRVTMTLADPIDPSIEERYQFVFELPERDSR